ncbi:MAG: M24 family metallopeptidase [Armatimonadetes bacterium]|nr:M24 family metallopeptidase [Armatimonadota bacterium]
MAAMAEVREKERRVRQLMAEKGLDAVLLSQHGNFAWYTCGGNNHVSVASDTGVASVLVTQEAGYLVCDNIESGRMMDEQVGDAGLKLKVYPWHSASLTDMLPSGKRIGSDTGITGAENIAREVARLRYSLTPEEIERYRALGRQAAECLRQTCWEVRPGMTEYEIAGNVGGKLLAESITPTVLLVAADDRISRYRHPVPTGKTVDWYVMIVICGRKGGLIASVTRLVHFGAMKDDLRRRQDAVTEVDAAFLAETRPGADVSGIFEKAVETYARTGFENEWTFHHQGGATGYGGRDYRANPAIREIVQANQAFAWNPSIAGTKSENTILVLEDSTEVITAGFALDRKEEHITVADAKDALFNNSPMFPEEEGWFGSLLMR